MSSKYRGDRALFEQAADRLLRCKDGSQSMWSEVLFDSGFGEPIFDPIGDLPVGQASLPI